MIIDHLVIFSVSLSHKVIVNTEIIFINFLETLYKTNKCSFTYVMSMSKR